MMWERKILKKNIWDKSFEQTGMGIKKVKAKLKKP
jgi:hypothetical protein